MGFWGRGMDESRQNGIRAMFMAALLLVASFLIYLPFEIGASLTIPPDSSEYMVSLSNFFNHGIFGFTLNGAWYPSRYSPWFSLSCLSPTFLLSGGNVLCGHWAMLVFALVLLVLLERWGRVAGMGRAALISPCLLLFMPDFVFYSRVVMTEIPYTALSAASALLFVRMVRADRAPSGWFCLAAGALTTWCGMARSTGLLLIVPFLAATFLWRMEWWRRIVAFVLMGLPAVLFQLVGMFYNWRTFGSPSRSGYQYWMPVPCDFPSLLFNLDNLVEGVAKLSAEPVVQMTAAMLVVCLLVTVCGPRVRPGAGGVSREYLSLLAFLLFHAGVLMALYLGYYWTDTRFFLPVTVCVVPLFLQAVSVSLQRVVGRRWWAYLALVAAFCVGIFLLCPTRYLFMTENRPVWIAEAQIARQVVPEGAVVMQHGDPLVLEFFGYRDRGITLLSPARQFDYTRHMVAPVPIGKLCATPKTSKQRFLPELIHSGVCRLPFPETFAENPSSVRDYLAKGRRVYLFKGQLSDLFGFAEMVQILKGVGLGIREIGSWELSGIRPNPVRAAYDQLLFAPYSMDMRPDLAVTLYEVVPEGPAA